MTMGDLAEAPMDGRAGAITYFFTHQSDKNCQSPDFTSSANSWLLAFKSPYFSSLCLSDL